LHGPFEHENELVHSSVSNINFVLWKRRGVQKYFLYAQMSIQCVECAFTVIYLLLLARVYIHCI
jgi:hypothetical protein